MGYYYESPPPPPSGMGAAPGCLSVSYVDSRGAAGSGDLCPAVRETCGSVSAAQQTLNLLGYGPIDVDGDLYGNQPFQTGLANFAAARGIPFTGSPDELLCAALVQASGGQVPTPTRVVHRVSRKTALWSSPAPPIPASATAPAEAEQPPAPAPAPKGWWAGQPTWMKATLIGSGVLLVGAVGYVALAPKKKAPLTPNARRRHPHGRGARRSESARRLRRSSRRHGG